MDAIFTTNTATTEIVNGEIKDNFFKVGEGVMDVTLRGLENGIVTLEGSSGTIYMFPASKVTLA